MTDHRETTAPGRADPDRWVDDFGDALFRYAWTRLRDANTAEDLVQETFLAAWKGRAQFAGKSSEKNWLFAILKNKIVDHLRRLARETNFTDLEFFEGEEQESFQQSGWEKHAWAAGRGPQSWDRPEQSLEREEFWKVLSECTDKLPHNIARVFTMREMEAIETPEICEALGISPNHLWVMLHRARLALRRCLELNWFKPRVPN